MCHHFLMLSLVVLAVLRMLNQFYSFSGGCIVDLRTEKMCVIVLILCREWKKSWYYFVDLKLTRCLFLIFECSCWVFFCFVLLVVVVVGFFLLLNQSIILQFQVLRLKIHSHAIFSLLFHSVLFLFVFSFLPLLLSYFMRCMSHYSVHFEWPCYSFISSSLCYVSSGILLY